MYLVRTWTQFRRDDALTDGKLHWQSHEFSSLTMAKLFADLLFEAIPVSDSVIEVVNPNGVLKYRLQKIHLDPPGFAISGRVSS
jgi:hypothetical protein